MVDAKPTCFIAMPVTTNEENAERYQDRDHWLNVLEGLFVPAVEAAGYEAVRPKMQGAVMIHAEIISQLQRADLVLGDLSGHNPNVFFELGVRTATNKPVALVCDEYTSLPFDTTVINTATYASTPGWLLESERSKLKAHIESSAQGSNGKNPMWQAFGLTIQATEVDLSQEDSTDLKLDLALREIAQLATRVENLQTARPFRPRVQSEPKFFPLLSLSTNDVASLSSRLEMAHSVLKRFADDEGGYPHWLFDANDDGRMYVTSEEFERLPLASRRAIKTELEKAGLSLNLMPF